MFYLVSIAESSSSWVPQLPRLLLIPPAAVSGRAGLERSELGSLGAGLSCRTTGNHGLAVAGEPPLVDRASVLCTLVGTFSQKHTPGARQLRQALVKDG